MRISSLSTFEYVSIVGHYNRLLYKQDIDPQLLTRGFTKEQIQQMMSHKNAGPQELISCSLHFKGSLEQWDYAYFTYTLTLFLKYQKHGVLPYPGSHSEQPAKIIEIFELYDQLDIERQEKHRKEQEREQQKASRKSRRK